MDVCSHTVIIVPNVDEDLAKIASSLDLLLEDNSVPRNVRAVLQRAKDKLTGSPDRNTGISSAVYALDEISGDINLPMHARTIVWNILSELESMDR